MSLTWEEIILCPLQPEFTPRQAHQSDAGFDVKAAQQITIEPHSIWMVKVWVKIAMPEWYVCLIFPRSSLPLKKWLMLSNSVWVLDSWYRDTACLQFYNLNDTPVTIEYWERIWQLLFVKYSTNVKVDNNHYDDFEDEYPSDRWANWFWSTGN